MRPYSPGIWARSFFNSGELILETIDPIGIHHNFGVDTGFVSWILPFSATNQLWPDLFKAPPIHPPCDLGGVFRVIQGNQSDEMDENPTSSR